MLFPTAYFPSILYVQEIAQFKKIELECLESFPKQTIRNRCYILSANGPLCLSIPIVHSKQTVLKTKDILFDNSKNWQKNHLRAIKSAYASSPYFEDYYFDIEDLLLNNPSNSLLSLNLRIMKKMLEFIDVQIEFNYNSSFSKNEPNRNRNYFEKEIDVQKYHQVFILKNGFFSNPSFLDLLMNEGPMARNIILKK